MTGDFETKQLEFQEFLRKNSVFPYSTKKAIDLGCGHGIQSIALHKIGFNLISIDFDEKLLNELQENSKGMSIKIIQDDIRSVKKYADNEPELIICAGDTITHLDNANEIEQLIKDCCEILKKDGKLILSFRDYTKELLDTARFIPVKNDNTRILTCFLEYNSDFVRVTDLLHEKTENGWLQKISSYIKVRILLDEITKLLNDCNMQISFNEPINRMITIISSKK